MELLKVSLSLLCVFIFTMLPSSLAQDSIQDYLNAHNVARGQIGVGPVQWDSIHNYLSFTMLPFPLSQDSIQDYLNAHNVARAQVGVGPIQWDERVASYARQYANERINDCRLVHSGGPYGENIAWGSPDLSGTRSVQMWVNEKQFYDYPNNTCAPSKVCGHYTQVVWRNSVRIGCAKVRCTNHRGTFVICNYDPRGNYRGQKPY